MKNSYLPINRLFRSKPKQKKKSGNNSMNISSANNSIKKKMHTSLNSPEKANETIYQLQNEIAQLKTHLSQRDDYIRSLENEIINLKSNAMENNEYEEYAKKQMLRNVKSLTSENEQLREEIENYKQKEIKMMKILYNMSKKGIPIEEMINCAEEDIGDTDNNKLDTEKTNHSSTTFTPISLNEQIKGVSLASSLEQKPAIPKLNLDTLNNKYNENYFSPPANKVGQGNSGNVSITTTTGYSNNITLGVNGQNCSNRISHEFLPGSTGLKDRKLKRQSNLTNLNLNNKSLNGLGGLSNKLKLNKLMLNKKTHNTSYNKI